MFRGLVASIPTKKWLLVFKEIFVDFIYCIGFFHPSNNFIYFVDEILSEGEGSLVD